MRTLNVFISDSEYERYHITTDKLSFADVLDLINQRQFKEHLEKSVAIAEKYGLSTMSMDDISDEVNAVRNAKNRH